MLFYDFFSKVQTEYVYYETFYKKIKAELTVKVFLNNKLITMFFQFLSIGNVIQISFQ